MAVLAGIGGVDVITRLAFCSGAVVATGTGRRHAAVIEHRARPAVGAVAVIAAVAGCDVIEGLPGAVLPLWQLKQVPITAV